MRHGKFHKAFLALLGLLLINPCLKAQEEREYIRKGNRLYKKSEFAGSEGMYRRALTQEKSAADGGFNLGDALYKQGRYSEAADEFTRAASASGEDRERQAESFYNLGNTLLKEQKFGESIEAYINSLKLKPDNMEAKYNLAYAQDQLKKQEEQQQQNQDKEKEENKDDNRSDEQKPEEQQKQEEKQDQQQQNQQQSISREDAKRLLDALAASEKKTQEKVQNEKAAKAKVRVIKNW